MSAPLAYVFDDELPVGALVCRILTTLGYAARQYSSLVPFLADTRAAAPSLAVIDLALGETDAIDVMRHLRLLDYDGKILLMSGHDEASLREFCEAGVRNGLAMLPPLRKPFRPGDLKQHLSMEAEVQAKSAVQVRTKERVVDFGEALQNRWLQLWYQPKIELKSMKVCGAEGLIRAVLSDGAIVHPGSMLPSTGDPLYRPLTELVVRIAVADALDAVAAGMSVKLAVNIPASVFNAPEFVGIIRKAVAESPRFPGLIIEVTEDDVVRDHQLMLEAAAQLRLCKTTLSIDDFGCGHSSFARLRQLPFTEIKIDREFVQGCANDRTKLTLCEAAIQLAHRLGAEACAEGIENVDDLKALVAVGCDTAQGFLFAKPMKSEVFIRSLSKSSVSASEKAALQGGGR